MTVLLGVGKTGLDLDLFTYIQWSIAPYTFHWSNIRLSMDEHEISVPPITSPLDTFTSLFQCSHPQSSNVYGIVLSCTESHVITCVSTNVWRSGRKRGSNSILVQRAAHREQKLCWPVYIIDEGTALWMICDSAYCRAVICELSPPCSTPTICSRMVSSNSVTVLG